MGERFPAVTDVEVLQVLRKIGFVFYRRAKGSHEVWRRDSDGRHTIVPRQAGRAIERRTLKSILEDTGLTVDDFAASCSPHAVRVVSRLFLHGHAPRAADAPSAGPA
ncbi:MAG: type II toxin-antitoxin system HicA family toxin [Planctomycetes bacterium]|nr:type II toxin-antitoxin system HicA family toxin [Planctomycetota bacterium]